LDVFGVDYPDDRRLVVINYVKAVMSALVREKWAENSELCIIDALFIPLESSLSWEALLVSGQKL
jgi:hypothetical protein